MGRVRGNLCVIIAQEQIMLSSTKSRRILHVISVSLALMMFGYGLFLKFENQGELPEQELMPKIEMAKTEKDSIRYRDMRLEFSEPN